MKKSIIIILSLFTIISCDAQKDKTENNNISKIEKQLEPIDHPPFFRIQILNLVDFYLNRSCTLFYV